MAVINFSGLASGIDSTALIEAMLEQQRNARIKPLQDRVTSLTETNGSFDRLGELLEELNSKSSAFRALKGGGLAKLATSSSEARVTAQASNSATNGSFTIDVATLAKNGTGSFNDRFSSSTAVINSSINNGAAAANRTVTVQVGTGAEQETVGVELTNTSTLQDFVTSYNAQSSKGEASVVNVGTTSSPSYAVVISSLNQGTDRGTLSLSAGSEITTAGGGKFAASTLSQATNATFTMSGVSGTITRSTNSVADVISGVTLSLQAAGSATISVANDTETSRTNVNDFVEAYNEVVRYIAENDIVALDEETELNTFGPLAGSSLDENLIGTLRSAFSRSAISGGLVNTLADFGIKTERDGTLTLDEDAFDEALSKDPQSIRQILENLGEEISSVDGTIAQFNRFNGLIDSAQSGNKTEISTLTKKIEEIEAALARQEQGYIQQFAKLESTVGRLNSQQASLAALIQGA